MKLKKKKEKKKLYPHILPLSRLIIYLANALLRHKYLSPLLWYLIKLCPALLCFIIYHNASEVIQSVFTRRKWLFATSIWLLVNDIKRLTISVQHYELEVSAVDSAYQKKCVHILNKKATSYVIIGLMIVFGYISITRTSRVLVKAMKKLLAGR